MDLAQSMFLVGILNLLGLQRSGSFYFAVGKKPVLPHTKVILAEKV